MSLFKEKCAICSTSIIKLFNMKLSDGVFICDSCTKHASDAFLHYHLDSLTLNDFKEYISQKRTDEARLLAQFEITKTFRITGQDVLYVDEEKGLWYKASDRNPDVFRLDQVRDCYIADEIPRTFKDIHDLPVEDAPVFEVIVIKLNHPFIKCVKLGLTNTKSPTLSEDHMLGNDIVTYFGRANGN